MIEEMPAADNPAVRTLGARQWSARATRKHAFH